MKKPTQIRRTPPRESLMDEVEWFLDAGMHPLLIAQEFGLTSTSIYDAARKDQNERVRLAFTATGMRAVA